MKKLTVLFVAIISFYLTSSFTTANNSNYREYEISEVSDLSAGKKIKAIWNLKYNNQEVPVTVVKRNVIDGTEYLVSSEYFEVSYLASSTGFGTKSVRNSWSNVPKQITNAVICKKEMKKQFVITPNKVDDQKALELIANYLPDLINDGYEHVLN